MKPAPFDPLPAQQLLISQLLTLVSEILEPPPRRNAGEWANENRVLPPDAPEPGPWRTDRVPWWKDIYAAFYDETHQVVVFLCGSQMSKTEGLFNCMAHRLDEGPYTPVMYVGPTEKLVKSIASDRWQKLLKSTPALWEKTAKRQLNKTTEQFIGGVRCGWAWAGSASEMAAHPAGMVMIDERSRMSGDVGGEGDPVSLGRARTKNYVHRKIGIFSTPTLQGADPTWALLDESQINFWAWYCVHCGEPFVPRLALLQWPKKATAAQAAKSAGVVCPNCGGIHTDIDKPQLNRTGFYWPHKLKPEDTPQERAVLNDYVPDDNPQFNPVIGFWASGLASSWVTFGDVAAVLVQAYKSGDDNKIQAEINTWGGECYRIQGEAPEWSEVDALRRYYRRGEVHSDAVILTLGADVQKDGIYYVIRAWGYAVTSWLIDEGFLSGKTEFDDVWTKLGEIAQGSFNGMRIKRGFVDSGYRPGDEHRRPDHAVYTFCRRFPGQMFPTKGHDTQDRPTRMAAIDYRSSGRVIKNGVKLWHLDTDYFKRWIHSRIRRDPDQPGGWFLHEDAGEDYCKQIVSEELVIKPSGKSTWVKRSRANHYLDCEVGALAAAIVERIEALPAPPARPEKPQSDKPVSESSRPSRFSRRSLL